MWLDQKVATKGVFRMNTSTIFQRDYEVVKQGVISQLTNEGTDPKGLEQEVNNISLAYMVGLKAQWLKVNAKNVTTFLEKYQEPTVIAMQLLEKYDFVSLVKTYRAINLSPKTKKVLCGIERYQDFINSVNNGKYQVVSKETKAPKPQVNAFTNAFIKQPKVVKPQVVEQPKQVSKPKPKPKAKAKKEQKQDEFTKVKEHQTIYDSSVGRNRFVVPTKSGNGQWTQVFKEEYLEDRALVHVMTKDNRSIFGRFLYIKSSKDNQKLHFFRIVTKSARFIDIPLKNIDLVLEYEAL